MTPVGRRGKIREGFRSADADTQPKKQTRHGTQLQTAGSQQCSGARTLGEAALESWVSGRQAPSKGHPSANTRERLVERLPSFPVMSGKIRVSIGNKASSVGLGDVPFWSSGFSLLNARDAGASCITPFCRLDTARLKGPHSHRL